MRKPDLFLIVALVIPVALHAEIPKLINYSGKIINNQTGQLASDGDYDMVFTLYDGPSGASVWQEGHNSPGNRVHITNGMYNVILGGITPMPSFDKNYYLEMQFKKYTDSTYEVFPKQQLLSNAYAIRSEYANQVADGAVSTTKIQNGAVNSSKIASKTITAGNIENSTLTSALIANNAIDNQDKAPWAAKLRFEQNASDLDHPKMAAGQATTSGFTGDAYVSFPSGYFQQKPYVSCTVLVDGTPNYSRIINVYNVTNTGFIARGWEQLWNDGKFYWTAGITFNWIAVGR